ncbi:hypothetical protein N7537_004812 [Penicillium hordei]|uniref:Uncharacterized protein n=1 Tax=Penicillium hordei TaxID=40994 RepID=A0AAD6EBZ5_9EURO|nr:uncharacterized protein N7537_004812 [Penicillium hordei]KAJ5608193.1 hypothetical protein N7537_004812 [Penicillium hordei]
MTAAVITVVFIMCQIPLFPASAKVSATPSLTSGNTAFRLFCTESTAAECGTYTWGGEDFTDYHCYSTPFIYGVYTTATFGTPVNGSVTKVTQYVTKIGDEMMNTYSSSFDVSTSAQATTTTAHTHAGNSGKSHSSRPSGTIAGGVVGAVAGCAFIGACVILFLRKKKKTRQQDQSNELGQNGYQSVPEDQSSQNDRKLHAEVEANDPCQKIAEIPGDSAHNVPHEVDSKTLIAELPDNIKR